MDLLIVRRMYLYPCQNYDDVLYKGAKPKLKEIGPFVYREHDDLNDPISWE